MEENKSGMPGPGRPRGYNLTLEEEKQMREFFTQMRDKSQVKRDELTKIENDNQEDTDKVITEQKQAVVEMFDMFELLPQRVLQLMVPQMEGAELWIEDLIRQKNPGALPVTPDVPQAYGADQIKNEDGTAVDAYPGTEMNTDQYQAKDETAVQSNYPMQQELRHSTYRHQVSEDLYGGIQKELCAEMPVHSAKLFKECIDVKYLYLLKNKAPFCAEIYDQLPEQVRYTVDRDNKFLPLWIGLAFQPVQTDRTLLRWWRIMQGPQSMIQCALCYQSAANNECLIKHKFACVLSQRNLNRTVMEVRFSLDRMLRTQAFSLGSHVFLCPFGCSFECMELQQIVSHMVDSHNEEELLKWSFSRPLLAMYTTKDLTQDECSLALLTIRDRQLAIIKAQGRTYAEWEDHSMSKTHKDRTGRGQQAKTENV